MVYKAVGIFAMEVVCGTREPLHLERSLGEMLFDGPDPPSDPKPDGSTALRGQTRSVEQL